jgi:hypothetical protein
MKHKKDLRKEILKALEGNKFKEKYLKKNITSVQIVEVSQ